MRQPQRAARQAGRVDSSAANARSQVKRIAAALAVSAVVAASLWLFVLVPSAHPRKADAIVVLAGDRDRLGEGLALLHDHVAPRLVISLDPSPWPRRSEERRVGKECRS